jgi:predicted MPP superfamily phosphohydrolase
MKPPQRSAWLWIALTALVCGLLDCLLLLLLPALHLSFGAVGLPLLMFGLGRLVVLLPFLLLARITRKSSRSPKGLVILSAILQSGLLAVGFYSLYLEPFHLTVTTLQPASSPSFLAGRPLRILHLTDLHIEHPTRREADILARAEEIQPDMIVLTGDYLNPTFMDDPLSQQETRQFLSQLEAPNGVYAVNGTVDDPERMSVLFDGLENIQVLNDEVLLQQWPGGTLALVGVMNSHDPRRDEQALQDLMTGVPADAYSLLLYHTPDLITLAAATGVDLYLAGHTHGGQVRLPFYGALITFSQFGKQYEMGSYQVDGTTLYVSRGLGMEGWDAPRLRFLCPPELVVIELGQ